MFKVSFLMLTIFKSTFIMITYIVRTIFDQLVFWEGRVGGGKGRGAGCTCMQCKLITCVKNKLNIPLYLGGAGDGMSLKNLQQDGDSEYRCKGS